MKRLAVFVPRTLVSLLSILGWLGVGTAGAQLPPEANWATIESQHFRITFGPGLEELARHTAHRAEAAHARLAAELAPAPAGKIDIVLTDFVDITNGHASPLPSNRIVLYARPPADVLSLGYFDDWIDLVVTHELAHIFHLDATSRVGGALRRVFGRVPVAWPFFPGLDAPTWTIEGLATYIESRFTGAGRVRGSYHEMVLRTAILEGAFDSIDRLNSPSAVWPGGTRNYVYGSMFLEFLGQRYGPEVQRRIVQANAGTWIPAGYIFDRVGRKATGTPFTRLYAEWRNELESRYHALAESLRVEGLTVPERLGQGGYNTLHPRVGPGGRVAYASYDGRHAATNRILDPATGTSRVVSRRNGVGPIAWFPDGALLTAQLEYDGPNRIFSDLYRVDDRGERRLTRGARLSDPDLTADGRRVVAVEALHGTNRLVIIELESGETRPLTTAEPGVHWAFPRWAPGGDRVAVGRWEAGEYDVVVLDTLGNILHRVTEDRALDTAPAWSPDGRYLIFSSDRSGIPNLYAYDLAAGRAETGEFAPDDVARAALYQVTNLLTGAFFPDVSPDGRWIYFSGYHADGFHIERIPFDPGSWRAPAPTRLAFASKGEGDTRVVASGDGEAEVGAVRPYSPIRSLLPRYWLPTIGTGEAAGTFVGVQTARSDLVGRHAYSVGAGYAPGDRLFRGGVSYYYAGLGQPIVELYAARNWDGMQVAIGNAEARLLEREDAAGIDLTLRRRRYRSSARLSFGGEWIHRRRTLHDAEGITLADPSDRLAGASVSAAFSNYRRQPFSISAEDGIGISLAARHYWDLEPSRYPNGDPRDDGYDEVSGQLTAYRALDLPGYANHVLAWRLATRWRHGPGAATFGVGGASSGGMDLDVVQVGGGYRLLPVRGFQHGDRRGTFGWSTSLEYRFPLTYIRRGSGLRPFFLDRLAGAVFLDAGGARCSSSDQVAPGSCSATDAPPLTATGAEMISEGAALGFPLQLRTGIAWRLSGGRAGPMPYVLLGLPF